MAENIGSPETENRQTSAKIFGITGVVLAACALIYTVAYYGSLAIEHKRAVTTAAEEAHPNGRMVDPIRFMSRVQQELPDTTDVTVINRQVEIVYHTYFAQMQSLQTTFQSNVALSKCFQPAVAALQTQYDDAKSAGTVSKAQTITDYQKLRQTIDALIVVAKAEDESA